MVVESEKPIRISDGVNDQGELLSRAHKMKDHQVAQLIRN